MKNTLRFVAAIATAVVLAQLLAPATPAQGAGRRRAGVVVVHSDNMVVTDCVAFKERTINGYQLLNRSRFNYMAATFSFGKQICFLDGEGCKTTDPDKCGDCHPADGNWDGKFWAYYVQDRGDTAPGSSDTGAKERVVRRGSIDYWAFGDGSIIPPAVPFSSICRS